MLACDSSVVRTMGASRIIWVLSLKTHFVLAVLRAIAENFERLNFTYPLPPTLFQHTLHYMFRNDYVSFCARASCHYCDCNEDS